MSNPNMISIKTKTTTAVGANLQKSQKTRKMKSKGKKRALRKPSVRPAFEDGNESDSKVSDQLKNGVNDDFVEKIKMTEQKLERWSTL